MNYNKVVIDIPISYCVQIVAFISTLQAGHKKVLYDTIEKHFQKSKAYTLNAINLLLALSIIRTKENSYEVDITILKQAKEDESWIHSLIVDKIVKLKPLIQYCDFIARGKKNVEAVKLVSQLYEIDKTPAYIQKVFDKWIKISGIVVTKFHANESKINNQSFINEEIQARALLIDKLGENFKKVNENTIDDFAEALIECKKDPKKALNDAGRGIEDYLRIDFASDIDLSKCNGIGQISSTLLNNKFIHAKHSHLLTAFSSLRSMGDAHGVDKNSTERWMIKPETALSSILIMINSVNSLIYYKESNKLLL